VNKWLWVKKKKGVSRMLVF